MITEDKRTHTYTHTHKYRNSIFKLVTVGNVELQQLKGVSAALTALFTTQLAKEGNKVLQISQLLIVRGTSGHCRTLLKEC